jgi:UDP-N-acetylglucosamine 2-epimerase (non-hydrolysing)
VKIIQQYELAKHISKPIKIVDSVGYFDFLQLLRKCKFVTTDSGGIQEITPPKINKRALVLRNYTERPESVNSNHAVLCKIDHKAILDNIGMLSSNTKRTSIVSPYGAGDAAVKITEVVEKRYS